MVAGQPSDAVPQGQGSIVYCIPNPKHHWGKGKSTDEGLVFPISN